MQMLLHYEYNYYGKSTNTGRVAAAEVGFSTLIENGIHILGDKRFYTIDRLSIPAWDDLNLWGQTDRYIPDLYDLYDLAGWEPYDLHDLQDMLPGLDL